MRALFQPVVALLIGLLLALPVMAREEIRSYDSNIVMATDGSVSVTETITVNAEGNEIRRGIYRDIPVVMTGSDGGKVRPDFEVTGVTRDGDQEMFRVERMGNFQRIWIGNPDYFLDRGAHTYIIRYTMSRMARSFEDHDELYWNATGNYWIFPILTARATVTLPDGAVISRLAGYTGPVGSTEQAVQTKRTSDTTASFRASRALGAGEGLTIAVAFNKGVIVYPTGLAALMERLLDLRELALPLLAALIAVAYNAVAWLRVGKDPDKGTIIPLFSAPKGFSPPLVHYIHKWGFSDVGWKALTSAIFDLGVKGLVTIDNSSGSLNIKTTNKQPDEPLSTAENVIFGYLQSKRTTIIGKINGPDLQKKRQEFTDAIEKENRSLWFKNNIGYSVIGFLLAIALLGGMVFSGVLDIGWLIGSIVIGILLAIFVGALANGFKGNIFGKVIGAIWFTVIAFNVFGFALESLTSLTINVASIAAISIIGITIVFAVLMRAPTLQGRKVMDQIDGLKLYLDTAEKDRMNMAGAPAMTVNRFERLLPYAIALDVEKPWSDHFEAELARGAVSDLAAGSTYSPGWYHGSGGGIGGGAGNAASNMSNAVSAAAASMTAAMVAAQPVQASSSGFSSGGGGGGGGGSSGGGGGGGGGGGW
ncbi:DUF2207 domain-containing protein [Devosia sp. SL43]|uniref:DUF2207 domain-containing protein n=1 Tax=Devosia sp. SL43 TaxID=2806348 RepID=UPI001F1BC8EA|nr:DUF2207 domain-containing protein [Devosia sp. SL43]UJW85302.1 DUF2207 domain-containing protein [Devosia sp. SL43]